MMTPTEAAWAAGFIDGEGYIGVTRANNKKTGNVYYRPIITAAQTVKAPTARLQQLFGGKLTHRENGFRGAWEWKICGSKELYPCLTILLPYLIVKRRQAELLMEFGATFRFKDEGGRWRKVPEEVVAHRKALWAAICELNGGRALQADRLSEEAPQEPSSGGGAIVGSASNKEDAEVAEMTTRLRVV